MQTILCLGAMKDNVESFMKKRLTIMKFKNEEVADDVYTVI